MIHNEAKQLTVNVLEMKQKKKYFNMPLVLETWSNMWWNTPGYIDIYESLNIFVKSTSAVWLMNKGTSVSLILNIFFPMRRDRIEWNSIPSHWNSIFNSRFNSIRNRMEFQNIEKWNRDHHCCWKFTSYQKLIFSIFRRNLSSKLPY